MYYYQENTGDTAMVVGRMPHLHRSIYRELKGRYFYQEAALPNSPLKLREWADVHTKRECEALQRVLEECFLLGEDDCWHVPAWDAQIAEFQRSQATKVASEKQAQASSARRVRQLRAERRALDQVLRTDIGLSKTELDALGMPDLRALAVQHLGQARVDEIAAQAAASVAETVGVTPVVTPMKRPEMDNREPGTGNRQPPHTLNHLGGETGGVGQGETKGETATVTAAVTALPGNAVAVMADALTAAGVPAHHTHPTLQELVSKGWTASALLAYAPAKWDKVTHRLAWLIAAAENQKAPAVGAVQEAKRDEPWTESRAGIEAMGETLGLGRWDEAAQQSGRSREDWPAYRAKVFRAAGVEQQRAAA